MKKCAWPDCKNEGTFAAPKSTKDIYDRQYFCQEHIKEFNKRWNGLEGMSEDDIFSMQTKSTWERPTQRFGIHGMSAKTSQFTFASAEDLFRFFKQRQNDERQKQYQQNKENHSLNEDLPADVAESCSILGVEVTATPASLKKRYLMLMKKHHPDLNQGSKKQEDHVKKINVAYKILLDYIKN